MGSSRSDRVGWVAAIAIAIAIDTARASHLRVDTCPIKRGHMPNKARWQGQAALLPAAWNASAGAAVGTPSWPSCQRHERMRMCAHAHALAALGGAAPLRMPSRCEWPLFPRLTIRHQLPIL